MSAFIIDKSDMDLVVATLRTLNIGNVEKPIHLDWTGQQLFSLNRQAVIARYPDCKGGNLPGPIDASDIFENYRFKYPKNWTPLAGYQALQSLLYQCSEGECHKTNFYQVIEKAIKELSARIIRDLIDGTHYAERRF